MIRRLIGVATLVLSFPLGLAQDAPKTATSAPAAGAPAKIAWQAFAPGAFRRALSEDRLVLLVLDMPWSDACARADRELWSNPEIASLVRAGYVPVRERADLRPDLARRYPGETLPAITFLLPDGTPLYLKTSTDAEPRRLATGPLAADKFAALLRAGVGYWREHRNEAFTVGHQREADAERTARPETGTAADTAVWGIAQQLRGTFDPEHRFFGGAPRLPRTETIEFMLLLGAEAEDPWRVIGLSALDTLDAKLVDPADGGLRRMALGLDWEDVQPEKLLDRNARYLDLLTLAWRQTGSTKYRDRARRAAAFVVTLARPDGFYRTATATPAGEDVPLTAPNALAAAAMLRAGAALDDAALVDRGLALARLLREQRWRPARLAPRAVVGGVAVLDGNLEDQAALAGAFVAAYEVTGAPEWLDAAKDLAATAVANLRGANGALSDIVPNPAAARPLRRALYPLNANADLVRVLSRLVYLGDRVYARPAREILAAFAKSWDRLPEWAAMYGTATYEYFFAPITVAVLGPAGDPAAAALRRGAMGAAFPYVIVRSFDPVRDAERIRGLGLTVGATSLVGYHGGLGTVPETDPAAVRGVLAGLREKYLAQQKSRTRMVVAEDAKPAPAKKSPPAAAAPKKRAAPKKGTS